MLVKRLESEVYADGAPYRVERSRNPDWPSIESAVRALHPFHRPSIWLYLTEDKDDDDFMTIMGGNGRYWLDVTTGPHNHRRLFNVERGSQEVPVQTSDQGFSQCEFHTTDRIEDVLAAVQFFCEHAECEPHLTWE